jgi:glycine/D-amino acid oxidase-like deaminating enzyme/nitrite reductase/ring-hydroxylating ferredoxin subunit
MNTQADPVTPRDGKAHSPWQQAIAPVAANTERLNIVYDCLVVGAGITGLTAALMLRRQGATVAVAEAFNIGFGTTGGTSAHINTFADTSYKDAEDAFGEAGAQLFADAVNEGAGIIKAFTDTYQIDCDYVNKPGYIYAEDEQQAGQLQNIYNATVKVGVDVQPTDNAPTPVPHKSALTFAGQAQFHPLKYINALQQQFIKAGGSLFENTRVETLEKEGDIHIAWSGDIRIRAKNVIYATHMPPGITTFNFRCAPYRSYVIAVKLTDGSYPDALVYDMQEPYHYTRTHVIDGEELLLVGGNDHKTGHESPAKAFAGLEGYVREYYNVDEVKYRWSSQYYVPADGFPYIGQIPDAAKGVYAATGYNGNGMMLGSIAGKILSDMVLGKKSKYEDIFSPSRIKPVAGFTEFVKENADVAYHFIADRLTTHQTESLNNLTRDTGAVLEVNGEKVAAYRDAGGTLHTLSPVCTHAKCIVNWNQEEKSWDCPCHGARYSIDGEVITGPATKGLQKINNHE